MSIEGRPSFSVYHDSLENEKVTGKGWTGVEEIAMQYWAAERSFTFLIWLRLGGGG